MSELVNVAHALYRNRQLRELRSGDKEQDRRIAEARHILGNRFYGPEEVKKGLRFSVDTRFVKDFTYTTQELHELKRDRILIYFADEKENGLPITMRDLDIVKRRRKSGGIKTLFKGKDDAGAERQDEEFYEKDTPRAGWREVTPELVRNSINRDYLEQTVANIEYLKKVRFAGKVIPEEYKAAIEELYAQKKELRQLMTTNPKEAARRLCTLKINELTRLTPVEAAYVEAVLTGNSGRLFLPENYTATNRWGTTFKEEIIYMRNGGFERGDPKHRSDDVLGLRPHRRYPKFGSVFAMPAPFKMVDEDLKHEKKGGLTVIEGRKLMHPTWHEVERIMGENFLGFEALQHMFGGDPKDFGDLNWKLKYPFSGTPEDIEKYKELGGVVILRPDKLPSIKSSTANVDNRMFEVYHRVNAKQIGKGKPEVWGGLLCVSDYFYSQPISSNVVVVFNRLFPYLSSGNYLEQLEGMADFLNNGIYDNGKYIRLHKSSSYRSAIEQLDSEKENLRDAMRSGNNLYLGGKFTGLLLDQEVRQTAGEALFDWALYEDNVGKQSGISQNATTSSRWRDGSFVGIGPRNNDFNLRELWPHQPFPEFGLRPALKIL